MDWSSVNQLGRFMNANERVGEPGQACNYQPPKLNSLEVGESN